MLLNFTNVINFVFPSSFIVDDDDVWR